MADMQQKYGEGTKTDLDYGKLVILVFVSTLRFKYRNGTRFIQTL